MGEEAFCRVTTRRSQGRNQKLTNLKEPGDKVGLQECGENAHAAVPLLGQVGPNNEKIIGQVLQNDDGHHPENGFEEGDEHLLREGGR